MSSRQQGLNPGETPSWSLAFWNRLHRYRGLLSKYWWVMALTISACAFLGAWYVASKPATFSSVAKISASIEGKGVSVGGNDNANSFTPQIDDFLMTQKLILTSADVGRMAQDRLLAQYPEMPPAKVTLDVVQRSLILVLTATGSNPTYTQRWLDATINAYQQKRRDMRKQTTDEALEKVKERITDMEGTLKADDDAMVKWQRDKGVVMDNGAPSGESELTTLRAKLSTLKAEHDQLSLMSPEQGFDRQLSRVGGASSPQAQSALESSTAEDAYRQGQQAVVSYQAQLDDLSRDLRPKHPKIIDLKAKLETAQKQVADLLAQNTKRIANRRELVASLIKATEDQITVAEHGALSNDLLKVEYGKLSAKKERDEKTYKDLQNAMIGGQLTSVSSDSVTIMEPASPPEPTPSIWIKVMALAILAGIGMGVAALLFIDRLDDRMSSISDFQLNFSEHVLGQIPRDAEGDSAELLAPDDARHQLVESFRNLRSTLLFMPMEGERPKTILITSAVPNEGKSTVSTNLALVMAFAGKKTLLIDCDLRRGAIHKSFGLDRSPGLTDVLGHNVNWKLAIRDTGVENLHVLPRGRNVPQPSEYLLGPNTDQLLKDLYPLYDFIIIDSSPILAADDTASLAPKIDATLFVVRLAFTSSKMTRKSLEILYKRQANIPGLILNQVDTASPEFVYYQYSEYYHAMGPDDDDEEGRPSPKKRRSPSPQGLAKS